MNHLILTIATIYLTCGPCGVRSAQKPIVIQVCSSQNFPWTVIATILEICRRERGCIWDGKIVNTTYW